MGAVLVAVESRLVGGNLEQDTAGGAEIDRPEVIAVDHRRHLPTGIQQRLADLKLCGTVCHRESKVMHRSCALLCGGRAGQGFDVDHIRAIAAGDVETDDVALGCDLFIAHEPQQFRTGTGVAQAHIGRVETADRVIGAHALAVPRRAGVVGFDQCKAVAVRTFKAQTVFAEAGFGFDVLDIEGSQTIRPEGQRSFGHSESRHADLARAGATAPRAGEREIGHDRPGRAQLVAVIKVVNFGRVEVDGFFHAAQTEGLGEKVIVGLGPARQRGHVVQSVDLVQHIISPLKQDMRCRSAQKTRIPARILCRIAQ